MAVQLKTVEFVGLRSALDPPARFSWGTATVRNVGLVKVVTSEGVTGWGETSVTFPLWSLEERAHTVKAVAELVEGRPCGSLDEIAATLAIAEGAMARLRLLWSPVAISAALGALEMALIDALARTQDVSAWMLFGGEPQPVALYAVGFTGELTNQLEQAGGALGEGYAAVKVRVGFGQQADHALVEAFRTELGADAEILADANMGWDRATAADMAIRLAPYRLGWLEEPLSRDDTDGLRAIGELAQTKTAAGENCYTATELLDLAESGQVDVLMPDLARCGGFLAALAGARRAVDLGLRYSLHHYASDLGFCAMLQLCAIAGPSAPVLRDLSPWPLRSQLLTVAPRIDSGHASIPDVPGLAPEPDPSTVERTRVL